MNLELVNLCVQLTSADSLCVTLPGGFQVCAQVDLELGDVGKVSRSFFAQINTALAPLAPFFTLLDFAAKAKDSITAFPEALLTLDPTKITDTFPGLLEAVEKLASMAPQLTIPRLVKQIAQAVRAGLMGMRAELASIAAAQLELAESALEAAKPGNEQLQLVVDCATSNLEAEIANIGQASDPLNQLVGLVNNIMSLGAIPEKFHLPVLGALNEGMEAGLAMIDAAIAVLDFVIAGIPIPV